MKKILPFIFLFFTGCIQGGYFHGSKKELTYLHIGFGLCATYLDFDDLEMELELSPKETPAIGSAALGN